MPRWIPEKKWEGQEVFIIGGGDSLKTFDWDLLKPQLTIGCNDAYLHGPDICKLCIFGDIKWYEAHKKQLSEYKGVVFTNVGQLAKSRDPWLWWLERESKGVHENALGWNWNTGAAAINLAVILGAKNIYLLGFDMKLGPDGNANWHVNNLDKPDPAVYDKFREGFVSVDKQLKEKYPLVRVFNVTDDSDLETFIKLPVKEFWSGRKVG